MIKKKTHHETVLKQNQRIALEALFTTCQREILWSDDFLLIPFAKKLPKSILKKIKDMGVPVEYDAAQSRLKIKAMETPLHLMTRVIFILARYEQWLDKQEQEATRKPLMLDNNTPSLQTPETVNIMVKEVEEGDEAGSAADLAEKAERRKVKTRGVARLQAPAQEEPFVVSDAMLLGFSEAVFGNLAFHEVCRKSSFSNKVYFVWAGNRGSESPGDLAEKRMIAKLFSDPKLAKADADEGFKLVRTSAGSFYEGKMLGDLGDWRILPTHVQTNEQGATVYLFTHFVKHGVDLNAWEITREKPDASTAQKNHPR